jgi:hypothetical protein
VPKIFNGVVGFLFFLLGSSLIYWRFHFSGTKCGAQDYSADDNLLRMKINNPFKLVDIDDHSDHQTTSTCDCEDTVELLIQSWGITTSSTMPNIPERSGGILF